MERIEVRTQAELDAAIESKKLAILIGGGYFDAKAGAFVEAWENSTVTAWGNSTVTALGNSTVTAWENSTVTAWENSTVTAWENSTVTAWGNSTVTALGNSTVTAWENSTVTAWENSTVTAWGNSTVTARGNSTVTALGTVIVRVFSCAAVIAAAMCTVVIHGCKAKVTGGIQIEVKLPTTSKEWCEFYDVPIQSDGNVILFKGVGNDFKSPHNGDYTPGTIPKADDWDDGKVECGCGLHFSPHPEMTLEFNNDAKRFIACPVALDSIVVHNPAEYPQKIKAEKCCDQVWECDRKGVRITPPFAVAVVAKPKRAKPKKKRT